MNTINFLSDKKNFPLSTQALEFMKLISQQAYQLAALGGAGNYILSGCVNTSGNTWTSGWVVVNGELLPFSGGTGTSVSNVRILQTKESVTAGYETYSDVYVRRVVEFGSNVGGAETFVWNTFTRVKSNLELAAQSATKTELEALSNLVMPKGGIIMWSGTIAAIPTGFALCDGTTVSGVVTPDLRGRFIVGYDSAKLNIPVDAGDFLTENYGAINNKGGKPNVTLSKTQIPPLTVVVPGQTGGDDNNNSNQNSFGAGDKGPTEYAFNFTKSITTDSTSGAHENRPPYYVLAFIIKVV